MANEVGVQICSQSTGTTAETTSLTRQINQVRVTNYHATQVLWVRPETGATAAAALTLAGTAAVAAADETFIIPAGQTKVVFKSNRPTFVALAVIGSGAATTFTTEGTLWFG